MNRLAGKVCLVTGSGSGIGQATALLMAKHGATVIVADLDLHASKRVAETIVLQGYNAASMEMDVANESTWRSAMETILRDHQRLDVLVNNAGITLVRPIAECSPDDWRRVMAVNLDGVFLGTRSAIATMDDGGSIVNVASVSGINPPGGGAVAYCTSKAAVRMFSKVAAIECADSRSGIRVNVVSPGGVKTPIWEKEEFFRDLMDEHGDAEGAFAAMEGDLASQRFFSPEQVAETIVYLASDESSHLTGTEVVLDRGHSC